MSASTARRRSAAFAALALCGLALAPIALADPAASVDPLIGTGGDRAGSTFPGAVVPFGAVQFSPVGTRTKSRAGYGYADTTVRGFALTRLSGAGCTNGGDLPLLPLRAPFARYDPAAPSATTTFSHRREHAEPGRYRVTLDTGIDVDLTASARTGFATLTYPGATAWLSLDVGGSVADQAAVDVSVVGPNEVRGSETSMGFCGGPARPTVYFVARFDRPIAGGGTWTEDGTVEAGVFTRRTINTGGALLRFDLGTTRTLRAKIGISSVSVENAALNLDAESPEWNGAALAARARAAWNRRLGHAQVHGGSVAERTIFGTALYHSFIHPTVAQDVNGEFIGRDQLVHVARSYTRYTNVSGWDVYRTQVPLLALLAPRVAADLAQSLVAGAQEEGWLSKWLLGSWETGVMVGDSADPIIAGAYAFGARGFDTAAALQAMVKGATVAQAGPFVYPSNGAPFSNANDARPDAGYVERPGLDRYLRLGYVPADHGEGFIWGSAATTLEYAIDDFALSRFALAVGRREPGIARRSANWRRLLNRRTGFIEPRNADGRFLPRYSHSVETGFVEGNSTQYTWLVPQDIGGLVAALGGQARVRARLDRFFEHLDAHELRPYAWLGNEPSFGTPWLYLWAGAPWRTQAAVRRAERTLFGARPAGLPGDDDLGATSAWYVWSALGLYPAIPGIGGLTVGSPLFPRATVRWNGGTLTIRAPAAGVARPYVHDVNLDGAPYARTWLPLSALRGRHVLGFALRATPQRTWGTSASAAPPSFRAR